MTRPTDSTWDIAVVDGGARRPSLDDLGGGQVLEEAPLPDPDADLDAQKVNQWAKQIEALGRGARSARISVRFSAGTPSVYQATGPGGQVVVALFGTPADNGVGDTTVSWALGKLPIPTSEPSASINGATVGMVACEYVLTGSDVTGVRVRTRDGTNTAADLAFTVEVG